MFFDKSGLIPIEIYPSKTLAIGAAGARDVVTLENLEARPNKGEGVAADGLYRYAMGTLFTLSFNATYAKHGAGIAVDIQRLIAQLKNISLNCGKVLGDRAASMSMLSLQRLAVKYDGIYAALGINAAAMDALTAGAADGAVVPVKLKLLHALAPRYFAGNRDSRSVEHCAGAVPTSELQRNGELSFVLNGEVLATQTVGENTDTWTAGPVTMRVQLLVDDFDKPLEVVKVREGENKWDEDEWKLPMKEGRPVRLGAVGVIDAVTDDTPNDLVQPESFDITKDGVSLAPSGQEGDDWVDVHYLTGVTDPVGTFSDDLPIVRGAAKLLSELPIVHSRMVFNKLATEHVADGKHARYLYRLLCTLTPDEQREIWENQRVPQAMIEQALSDMTGTGAGAEAVAFEGTTPTNVARRQRSRHAATGVPTAVIRG